MKRPGLTLIELLIVIFITGVLVGLMLVAILFARRKSDELSCKNSLKQITLGNLGQFAQDPVFFPGGLGSISVLSPYQKIYNHLGFPIVDPNESNGYKMEVPDVSFIRCPSDVTLIGIPKDAYFNERTSYPYNALVFKPDTSFPGSISDGTSNTFGFSERYGKLTSSEYLITVCAVFIKGDPYRPSTFSDPRFGDNIPLSDPATKACIGSASGETFLIQPDPKTATGSDLISGHTGGINMGYLDGSVRYLSRDISPAVFWAQVTPAIGD